MLFRSKWSLAEFLKDKGVPHPITVKYSSGVAASILEGLQYPVIIKPIDKGNAQGIETFDQPEALKSFFENQKLKHEYIIQPLIDGYDIDCSVLCMEGRIVTYTIQKAIVASKVRFRAAVGIEFLYDERVLKVVEKMMNILNWSGVAHIDLRYDAGADEIKVIEVNARYWGSLMGSFNAGINFPVLAIKARLGEVVPKIAYKFSRYFQGDLPIRLIMKGLFRSEKQKVRLRETNLYYTIKDPLPVLLEKVRNIKTRF